RQTISHSRPRWAASRPWPSACSTRWRRMRRRATAKRKRRKRARARRCASNDELKITQEPSMPIELWLAYAAAVAVLLVIPGPTILTVISYSVAHGNRANAPLVAAVALGDSTALVLSL